MCVWPAGTIIMLDITHHSIHPSIHHSCFSSTGRGEGLEPIPAAGGWLRAGLNPGPYCKATQKTGEIIPGRAGNRTGNLLVHIMLESFSQ